jgi:hypothetical protein
MPWTADGTRPIHDEVWSHHIVIGHVSIQLWKGIYMDGEAWIKMKVDGGHIVTLTVPPILRSLLKPSN